MSPSPLERLQHMRDECETLLRHVVPRGREWYDADPLAHRAVERCLAILGEAAKHVPETVRTRAALIEWHRITGMRNRLVHDYLGTNHDLVWSILNRQIPKLKDDVEGLIAELEAENSAPPPPSDVPAV